MRKPLVYVILGFAAGIAFVIACGTSGGLTDAGADSPPACNCPTPRSFGSRLRRFTVSDTMTPSDTEKVVFVSCDGRTQNPRAIAIGGGCDTLDTGVALTESSNGNSETKWSCTWRNLLGGGATLNVRVLCLLPDDAANDAGP